MCWGKMLAWIQWQVGEHVKELRRDHPDCLIGIIAWWCGNEISGQWGCIPTRMAPGLAYRDPTVTTEAAAKKVRGSAATPRKTRGTGKCSRITSTAPSTFRRQSGWRRSYLQQFTPS